MSLETNICKVYKYILYKYKCVTKCYHLDFESLNALDFETGFERYLSLMKDVTELQFEILRM